MSNRSIHELLVVVRDDNAPPSVRLPALEELRGYQSVVAEELRKMGDSPVDVADFLADAGAEGNIDDAETCVVFRYLQTKFGLPIFTADSYVCLSKVPEEFFRVELPKPVAVFIEEFDDELYPDLIAGHDDE